MKYLRTEGELPRVLDRDLPEDCQYIKEWDIYEAYECVSCGKIREDMEIPCQCGEVGFVAIEVDEDMEAIEDER